MPNTVASPRFPTWVAVDTDETAELQHLQLLAVLVRDADLGLDHPPEVEQGLWVLSSRRTLSFLVVVGVGVRADDGVVLLLVVATAAPRGRVQTFPRRVVRPLLHLCFLVGAVEALTWRVRLRARYAAARKCAAYTHTHMRVRGLGLGCREYAPDNALFRNNTRGAFLPGVRDFFSPRSFPHLLL